MTRWTGTHTLVTLLGTFAVVLGVNVFFMVAAYSTFSGEDEQKPYLQGVEYNETLARHALQMRLGWKATVAAKRLGRDGVTVAVAIVDKSGKPVTGVMLAGELRHPADAEKDRDIALTRSALGVYEGVAKGIAPGAWDLIVTAENSPATPFEASRRLWLR
jgi:nitrogen fixation protein FixH